VGLPRKTRPAFAPAPTQMELGTWICESRRPVSRTCASRMKFDAAQKGRAELILDTRLLAQRLNFHSMGG